MVVRWTGLAPWEFEFPFPGSLTSTFLQKQEGSHVSYQEGGGGFRMPPPRGSGVKKGRAAADTPRFCGGVEFLKLIDG